MKLTETELRSIIREEISKVAEADMRMSEEGQEIVNYLSKNGTELQSGDFEYEGLHFNVDPMGGMAVFVNVFRDKWDSESVVSAKVEGGQIRFKEPVGPGMRPKTDTIRYTGPKQLIDALVERATGGQTAYR